MAEGTFPKPVPIGTKAVGWIEDEIDAWIEARIAERNAKLAGTEGDANGDREYLRRNAKLARAALAAKREAKRTAEHAAFEWGRFLDPDFGDVFLRSGACMEIKERQRRHGRDVEPANGGFITLDRAGNIEFLVGIDAAILGEDHRLVVPPIDQPIERNEVEIARRQAGGAEELPVVFGVLICRAVRLIDWRVR